MSGNEERMAARKWQFAAQPAEILSSDVSAGVIPRAVDFLFERLRAEEQV
jgi:hypothetical protein